MNSFLTRNLLLALLTLQCAPRTVPNVVPPPALAPVGTAARVVLVSFDGMGADALARRSDLAAFRRLEREGASARIIPVDPTLTAPAHVAMLTGTDPQRNGVVSNRFHLPDTPPEREQRGMALEPDVETLVEAARRQGKRVGVVPFPTVDNATPRRSSDFGVAWTAPLTPARLVKLTRADFKREWVPPGWTARPQRRRSYSPIMRASVEWVAGPVRMDVVLVAYDTTDDRLENYDAFFIENLEREIHPDADGWFPISRNIDEGLAGSWSKLMRTAPNLDMTLYWGSVSRSNAWPASFRALLDERAGFWPGAPEENLDVDLATFTDQLERMSRFYTQAQLLAIENERFDLLLCYQSQIDGAAHQYLGQTGRERAIDAAFQAAGLAVSAIADALQPTDALVVTGDHGIMVTTQELRLNTFLSERGYGPRWRAFTSGTHGHLYRSSGPNDSDALVRMLEESDLFERVEEKSMRSHRNSGDIVVWSMPHVALSAAVASPSIITITPRGEHGGINAHRELHPPFFAIGAGVPRGNLGEIPQTKIARFVAGLLGIQAPEAAH